MLAKVLVLLLSVLLVREARSDSFQTGEELFSQRADSRDQANFNRIARAKEIYRSLIAADPVRAVEKLGALAFFEGELLTSEEDYERRAAIFNECRVDVEALAEAPTARTQYYYWKALCSAFWVQAVGIPGIADIVKLRAFFNEMLSDDYKFKQADFLDRYRIDLRYQGGGLYRTLGGVISKPHAAFLRSGLPNASTGIELIGSAIASASHPAEQNSGEDYFCNFRTLANAYLEKSDRETARRVLKDAIADIEGLDHLPTGLEPETTAELRKMKSLLEAI